MDRSAFIKTGSAVLAETKESFVSGLVNSVEYGRRLEKRAARAGGAPEAVPVALALLSASASGLDAPELHKIANSLMGDKQEQYAKLAHAIVAEWSTNGVQRDAVEKAAERVAEVPSDRDWAGVHASVAFRLQSSPSPSLQKAAAWWNLVGLGRRFLGAGTRAVGAAARGVAGGGQGALARWGSRVGQRGTAMQLRGLAARETSLGARGALHAAEGNVRRSRFFQGRANSLQGTQRGLEKQLTLRNMEVGAVGGSPLRSGVGAVRSNVLGRFNATNAGGNVLSRGRGGQYTFTDRLGGTAQAPTPWKFTNPLAGKGKNPLNWWKSKKSYGAGQGVAQGPMPAPAGAAPAASVPAAVTAPTPLAASKPLAVPAQPAAPKPLAQKPWSQHTPDDWAKLMKTQVQTRPLATLGGVAAAGAFTGMAAD